jgi:ATP-binding cassette, subfamily B, multidrug efflux pump
MNAFRTFAKYIQHYRFELIIGACAIVAVDVLGLLPPWLIKLAIDHVKTIGAQPQFIPSFSLKAEQNPLLQYSLLIVATAGLQMFFRYQWRKHLFGISRKVEYDLRSKYFQHLQKLHWGFFQHARTGDIMSRSTNDIQAIREFLGIGIVIIVDSVTIIPACLVLMTMIHAGLAVISLLPMMIVSFIVVKFNREIRRRFASVQEQLSTITTMAHENIAGMRVVQAYTQEENELNRFKELNRQLIEKNLWLARMSGAFFPLMVFTTGLTTALILWVGGREVIQGHLTLGSYVAFTGYLAMLTWPMAAVGFLINLSQRGIASLRRVEEIMAVQPEVDDGPDAGEEEHSCFPGGATGAGWKGKGEIEFKSITFAYHGRNGMLSDVNLNIRAGSSLSLIGPVGSGKSTLVRLLPRIYDPSAGVVLLDGIDIKTIPLRTLRDLVGYVEQEPFLFSDTIRENILFGARRGAEKEVEKAAAIAGLDRDLALFPRGLDTVIGERGVTLSGGQKQRVALARALIKKPKILILDDAFSNLDADTEERVFGNIEDSLGDATIILISHRISTIQQADTIAIMQDGRIEETGVHDELISKSGFYSRIYKQQLFLEKEIIEE